MGKIQDNFCRNLKALRKKYGLREWQTGRILKLSDETMRPWGRGSLRRKWTQEPCI